MPLADPVARAAYHTAYEARRRGTRNKYYRAWREAHPGAERNWQPPTTAQLHEARLRYRYGITAADYENLLVAQGGGCAICGRTYSTTRRLSVDHDHATGRVRGLLCQGCNVKVGHFEGADFEAIAAYLARFGGQL